MKIISWNCNMAFRKKWEHIVKFDPDILIVQECENPSKFKAAQLIPNHNEFIWVGENLNKGIAIISFNKYHIERSHYQSDEFKYVVPIKVTGPVQIDLYAIWAMHHRSTQKAYIGQIWDAVNFYKSSLSKPSILIGDWNSNAIWDSERKIGNHSQVVDFLKAFDISSVYHYLYHIEHGQEVDPTLYLLKKKERPYHIDYCFCSNNLINENTTIEIGVYEDWIKVSDHMPVIIDRIAVEGC